MKIDARPLPYIILPKYLYRRDDGERFTLQDNGKYTMDTSNMQPKYEYPYELLIRNGFKDSLDKCETKEYISNNNDGHGNGDFD